MDTATPRRPAIRLACLLLAAALSACAGEKPPTVAELTLTAAEDVNLDATGRPSPVVVRVYQLTGPLAFNRADFLQLYGQDAAALGTDLRGKGEVALTPGETKAVTLQLKPDAVGVGLVALYRNFQDSGWRAYTDLPANKTTPLTAEVGAKALTLSAGK